MYKRFIVILFLQTFVVLLYSAKVPPICSQPSSQSDFLQIEISKQWKGFKQLKHVCHTPSVIDLNEDTFSDIIFIVSPSTDIGYVNGTHVVALSGRPEDNLKVMWNYTNSSPAPYPQGNIAVAKTQNGGLICFPSSTFNNQTFVTCINFSGSHLFTTLTNFNDFMDPGIQISIINIDTIGTPYIIAGNSMLDSSGVEIWNDPTIVYKWSFTISDLNNDGFPELIYADRVLNPLDGSRFELFNDTRYSSSYDVYTPIENYVAVADFDGDGNGDILKIGDKASIWMHNGTLLAKYTLPEGDNGYPVIRDLNNDGNLDFGFQAFYYEFRVYTFNKLKRVIEPLWNITFNNNSDKYIIGAITADLNGDGLYEVLFADDEFFYIFSSNGSIIYKNDSIHYSETWVEYPLYVDLENDGYGEIILTNTPYSNLNISPIVILSAKQKEHWTPTTSEWNDWGFTYHEGFRQDSVNSTFFPNWQLPWKDRNFSRGAINSCWICSGYIDPQVIASLNIECRAQQWIIHEQSGSVIPGVSLKVETDLVLGNDSTLNIVVSEQGEAGTLDIDGSFVQDGFIVVDLSKVELVVNQPIVLSQVISFGNVNGSRIRIDQVDVITSPSVDPCFVEITQVPEQNSLSLSLVLSKSRSSRCAGDSESSDNTDVIVGLVVGLVGGCIVFLIAAAVVIVVIVTIRNKKKNRALRVPFDY